MKWKICKCGVVNKQLLILPLLFVFILVSKGWEQSDVDKLLDVVRPEENGIKAVFFYNKPNLRLEGVYTVAPSITFYNPEASFEFNRWVALHELGHHFQWVCEWKLEERFAYYYANLYSEQKRIYGE